MPAPTHDEAVKAVAEMEYRLEVIRSTYNSFANVAKHDDEFQNIKTQWTRQTKGITDPIEKLNIMVKVLETTLVAYMGKKKQTPAQFTEKLNDNVNRNPDGPFEHNYPRLLAITLNESYQKYENILRDANKKSHFQDALDKISVPAKYKEYITVKEAVPAQKGPASPLMDRVNEILDNYVKMTRVNATGSGSKTESIANLKMTFDRINEDNSLSPEEKKMQMVGAFIKLYDDNMSASGNKIFSKKQTPEQLIDKVNANYDAFQAGTAPLDNHLKRMLAITMKDIHEAYKGDTIFSPAHITKFEAAFEIKGSEIYKFKPLSDNPKNEAAPDEEISVRIHR